MIIGNRPCYTYDICDKFRKFDMRAVRHHWNWALPLGSQENEFPLLFGVGRFVIKGAIVTGAAMVIMADSAKAYCRKRRATAAEHVNQVTLAV
jgi:hypothetical protein